MTSLPIASSFLLHLAILSTVCYFAGYSRTVMPPPALPHLYVELASSPPAVTAPVPAARPRREPQPKIQPIQPETRQVILHSIEPGEKGASVEEEDPASSPEPSPPRAPIAPEINEAFASASRMQFMMLKNRGYLNVAGMAVRKMVEGKLSHGAPEEMEGEKAEVVVSYGDKGATGLAVATDNAELRTLLKDEAAWSRVPHPGQFSLKYERVSFMVRLEKGMVRVALSPQ